MSDLVERLREDAAQLKEMNELASRFAGAETGVRVKDVAALLTDLIEAATALEAQAKELAALREENEALQDQRANAVIVTNWFDLGRELDVPEGGSVFDTVMGLKARAETAEQERDQAREALKPFAEAWVWSCEFNVSVQSHIKVEDFRRAARAITGKD